MLIIFDLDDTLIDTSGTIIPFLFEKILIEMQGKGFPVSDIEREKQLLLELNKKEPSSKSAIEKYLQRKKGNVFMASAFSMLYESLPDSCPVVCRKNSLEVLLRLKKDHELALVTSGMYKRQIDKLKKAGIDRDLFCKILVTDTADKEKAYGEIVSCCQYLPYEIVVCGDRIDADLVPAKKWGMTTVHMRYGRGLYQKKNEYVDFTICEIEEIEKIIRKLLVHL
ncbi:MAG: HAD family hydrolase [Parachlamydiales bacterium]|nr:HAD family hydrolase [Parachlamydiales bacterium]